MSSDLVIDDRVVLPGRDLSWTAARSSGPGGQNVNKVATKVVLRFDLPGTEALSPAVKARLRKIARGRLDADGRVVVTSQATRNRVRNLEDAREKLAELVRAALVEPRHRRTTRPSRAARERRLRDKHLRAERKRDRTPIRD
jgi:ribosome-associated protein